MSTYGTRLKQERLRLHLTQQSVASAAGISRPAQSAYEQDIRLPRADYLAAISVLGMDVAFILSGRPSHGRTGNGALIEQ